MVLQLEAITIDPAALSDTVDLPALFGNDRPVELEIGCGKGAFLLRQARANPDRNYLGIEWANKYYRFTADRMARWGVSNVRIMRTDARHFFMHRMPAEVLSALHIYHPDPWPKKRHQRRRLLSTEFANAAVRTLRTGGRLAVQTDHADYAEQIESVLGGRSDLEPVSFDDPTFGTIGERTETNFEIKYLREGRRIWRWAFRRLS